MAQELSFRGEACISGTCKGRDDDVYDGIDDFDLREGATNGDRVSRQIQVAPSLSSDLFRPRSSGVLRATSRGRRVVKQP